MISLYFVKNYFSRINQLQSEIVKSYVFKEIIKFKFSYILIFNKKEVSSIFKNKKLYRIILIFSPILLSLSYLINLILFLVAL